MKQAANLKETNGRVIEKTHTNKCVCARDCEHIYIVQTAQCFVICGDNESVLHSKTHTHMHNEHNNKLILRKT